jgi:RNA polymerase sigma-70 factor (sigma-E family)
VAIDAMFDGRLADAGPAEVIESRPTRDELLVELFNRDHLHLCRLATLLLSDPARAEEVVQEAFLRTFSGWAGIRDPDRVDAYIRRAVVNLCRSGLRSRRVERTGNEAAWRRVDAGAGVAGPDSVAVAVLDAVQSLPPRQRDAVVLHYFADLSGPEVAHAMGCAQGTVKSQLAKARAALARTLGAEEDGHA